MIQTLCDHSKIVIPALLAAIGGMGAVAIWIVKRWIKQDDDNNKELHTKLDLALANHDECQKTLPEKYANKNDVQLICGKIDKLAEIVSQFHYVFRTKDEAQREWRLLENRLTQIEGNIKALSESQAERHREIWDKLNRVVDFFKERAEKIEGQLNGVQK